MSYVLERRIAFFDVATQDTKTINARSVVRNVVNYVQKKALKKQQALQSLQKAIEDVVQKEEAITLPDEDGSLKHKRIQAAVNSAKSNFPDATYAGLDDVVIQALTFH